MSSASAACRQQHRPEGSVSCSRLWSEGETAPPGGQSSRSAQAERFLRSRRCFQLPVRLFFPSDGLNDLPVCSGPLASFSRPPWLTSLLCPRPVLSLSPTPSFLTPPAPPPPLRCHLIAALVPHSHPHPWNLLWDTSFLRSHPVSFWFSILSEDEDPSVLLICFTTTDFGWRNFYLLPGLKPQPSRLSPENELTRVVRSKVRVSRDPVSQLHSCGLFHL